MKDLLIIRSASFQQLDMNIVVIKDHYPDHRIHLLTHEHGVKLAEKYKNVDQIHVYPYTGPFESNNKVTSLMDHRFDVVVVLVTNLTGHGFFNVMRFSLTISAATRVICNMVSDMWPVSVAEVRMIGLKNLLFTLLSLIFAGVFALFSFPFLLFRLRRIEKESAISVSSEIGQAVPRRGSL